jgi:hypothetical protein
MRLMSIRATTTTHYMVDIEIPADVDADDPSALAKLVEDTDDDRLVLSQDTTIEDITDDTEPVEEFT